LATAGAGGYDTFELQSASAAARLLQSGGQVGTSQIHASCMPRASEERIWGYKCQRSVH